MKKILVCLLLAFLLICPSFASPKEKAFGASISDNSVIILSGSVNSNNKLIIVANLKVNTGISGMTIELSYNKDAMILENLVFDSALASLEPIHTNPHTSEGYAVTPFIINYMSVNSKNDFSKGKLFTLTFKLLDNIKDGSYKVSLKYEKNKDVNYYDENGEVRTKNLYIDNAEIYIKNNSVTEIKIVGDDGQNSVVWIIVLCTVIPVLVALGVLVYVKVIRKKRKWKRI